MYFALLLICRDTETFKHLHKEQALAWRLVKNLKKLTPTFNSWNRRGSARSQREDVCVCVCVHYGVFIRSVHMKVHVHRRIINSMEWYMTWNCAVCGSLPVSSEECRWRLDKVRIEVLLTCLTHIHNDIATQTTIFTSTVSLGLSEYVWRTITLMIKPQEIGLLVLGNKLFTEVPIHL